MNAHICPKWVTRVVTQLSVVAVFLILFSRCDLDIIAPIILSSGEDDPQSSFTYVISEPACTSDCEVVFINTSENATSYQWNFGDGTAISTAKDPTHVFATNGSFEVNLKALKGNIQDDTTIVVNIDGSSGGASDLDGFIHEATASNISTQLTRIDNALTDNKANKIIVVSPVLGLNNTSVLGLYYFGNRWNIFNESLAPMQPTEKFNVIVSDPSASAFVHQVTGSNVSLGYTSTIDNAATNNNPNARILLTPIWEIASDYNNHPMAVAYDGQRWRIVNLDKENLPIGLKVNIIVSTTESESFVHTSNSSNVAANYTVINDSKTNNKPALISVITQNQGQYDKNAPPAALFSNPHQTGMWYKASTNNWAIINENSLDMAEGIGFNVLMVSNP